MAKQHRCVKRLTASRQKPGRKPGNKAPGKRGTAPGPLTPRGMTSTTGHQEAVGEARRAARTQQALNLLDQGMTYEQIGVQLGVSAKTICLDFGKWHDRITEEIKEKIEHRRLREERKSLLRDRAVMPLLYGQVRGRTKVIGRGKNARVMELRPDPGVIVAAQTRAHRALTDSGRFRAELFGLNAPIKIAPTDLAGTRRYHDLTEEELERVLRQKAALLGLPPTVDVTPGRNGDGPSGGHG